MLENLYSFLNFIMNQGAAIASLASAIFAFWQAYRARKAAHEVIVLREQLKNHRQTREIVEVQSLCNNAVQTMKKYSAGRAATTLAGISPEKDIQIVREFMLCFQKHSSIFKKWRPDDSDNFINSLSEHIQNFSNAKNDTKIKTSGSNLLSHLGLISGFIKEFLDELEENIS